MCCWLLEGFGTSHSDRTCFFFPELADFLLFCGSQSKYHHFCWEMAVVMRWRSIFAVLVRWLEISWAVMRAQILSGLVSAHGSFQVIDARDNATTCTHWAAKTWSLLICHVSDVSLMCCWLLEGFGTSHSDRTCFFFSRIGGLSAFLWSQSKYHHFCWEMAVVMRWRSIFAVLVRWLEISWAVMRAQILFRLVSAHGSFQVIDARDNATTCTHWAAKTWSLLICHVSDVSLMCCWLLEGYGTSSGHEVLFPGLVWSMDCLSFSGHCWLTDSLSLVLRTFLEHSWEWPCPPSSEMHIVHLISKNGYEIPIKPVDRGMCTL